LVATDSHFAKRPDRFQRSGLLLTTIAGVAIERPLAINAMEASFG